MLVKGDAFYMWCYGVPLVDVDKNFHICRVFQNNRQVFFYIGQDSTLRVETTPHIEGCVHDWIGIRGVICELKFLLGVLDITESEFDAEIAISKVADQK